MRRTFLLLSVLVVGLAAGCGGSSTHAATTTAPAQRDPARTLRKLVAGSAAPLRLLTPASRKRASALELSKRVAGFADDAPVHSRHVGGDWAVAWTVGRHSGGGTTEISAYAVALELRGGTWLASIAGPVVLRPLGPDPRGTAASVPQVAAEVKATEPIVDTALLVDGRPIATHGGGPSSRFISIYGAPAKPLKPGRHVAVAFARAGADASATAWWFTVRGR